MDSYTVDASVVLKWISSQNESYLHQAKQLFFASTSRQIRLIAPTLLKAEVTNVLLKKKHLTVKQTQKFLNIINQTHLTYIGLSDSIIHQSVSLAHQYHLSIYDGIYVAVSQLSNTPLISADAKAHMQIKNCILLENFNLPTPSPQTKNSP